MYKSEEDSLCRGIVVIAIGHEQRGSETNLFEHGPLPDYSCLLTEGFAQESEVWLVCVLR